MNNLQINAIVNSSIESVSSLSEKEGESSALLDVISFSSHDFWLYAISFIGLIILAIAILFVMKRQKNIDDKAWKQ